MDLLSKQKEKGCEISSISVSSGKKKSSHNIGILKHDEQNAFENYVKIERQACLASQFKSLLYFHWN